jgi:hypothetical protein
MGRYYSGDIEGKFMFAVQSSDAAERFGAEEMERSHVDYMISYDSYQEIKKQLEDIKSSGAVDRVERMFEKEGGYNNEIADVYGVSGNDLSEYADYNLGKKILDYFDSNPGDDCYFEAEI